MRLIDADELLSIVRNMTVVDKSVMHRLLVQMPSVDVVPVQRCDGCRYADWHSNGCIAYCTRHGTDGHVADSFCSEGEKDGGDEQTQKVE